MQKLEHLKSDKTTLPGKKRQKAADLIKEYFEAWRRGNDDNLYPLLQLLLPGAVCHLGASLLRIRIELKDTAVLATAGAQDIGIG